MRRYFFSSLLLYFPERFQDAQRHYRNASKLHASSSSKPMTGLLKAQLMEYEVKEAEAAVDAPAAATAVIHSAMEKIYTEIDHLEEFNRSAGLSQARGQKCRRRSRRSSCY